MQNLEMSLKGKMKDELRDIAREFSFSGYSSLNKENLVTLIIQNMKSKDFEEKVKERLNESMLLFLDIVLEKEDYIQYNDLKLDFSEIRSLSTFYKVFSYLSSLGLVFETEDEKGATMIYVPREIARWLRKYVFDQFVELKPEEIEEIEIEEDMALYTSFKTMEGLFFSSFLPIENLRDFLKKNNMNPEGSKKELIERTIYESNLEPEKFIDELFFKTVLQDICVNLQCPKSGTKTDLINRIITILPFKKPNLIKKVEIKPAISVGSKVKPPKITIPQPPSIEPIKPISTDDKNFYKDPDKFRQYLKTLKIPRPRDERELSTYLSAFLKGKFGEYEVNVEERGRGGRLRYDITLGGEVLIELKVAKSSKTIRDGVGQIVIYLGEQIRYRYGILGVYDDTSGKNLKSQFQQKYLNKVYIIFW